MRLLNNQESFQRNSSVQTEKTSRMRMSQTFEKIIIIQELCYILVSGWVRNVFYHLDMLGMLYWKTIKTNSCLTVSRRATQENYLLDCLTGCLVVRESTWGLPVDEECPHIFPPSSTKQMLSSWCSWWEQWRSDAATLQQIILYTNFKLPLSCRNKLESRTGGG